MRTTCVRADVLLDPNASRLRVSDNKKDCTERRNTARIGRGQGRVRRTSQASWETGAAAIADGMVLRSVQVNSRIAADVTQSPRNAAAGSHSSTTRENARPHHSCFDSEYERVRSARMSPTLYNVQALHIGLKANR